VLDDKGFITMIEDRQKEVLVNYTHTRLVKQELKTVYVNKKGRFIKYKNKRYYIKEK